MVRFFVAILILFFAQPLEAQSEFGLPDFWPETQVFSSDTNEIRSFPEKTVSTKSWFNRKLFNEHFISYHDTDLFLFIDPMIDVSVGKSANYNYWKNGRGVRAGFVIKDKLEVMTGFMETQAIVPEFLVNSSANNNEHSIYGYGRTKVDIKDGPKIDYSWVFGHLKTKITQWWQTEVGYGRKQIGDGFRSLVLSNQSALYPYIENKWKYKKVEYRQLLSSWTNLNRINATYNIEGPYLKQSIKVDEISLNLGKLKLSYIGGATWQRGSVSYLENMYGYIPLPSFFQVDAKMFTFHGAQFNLKLNNTLVYVQQVFRDLKGFQVGVLQKIDSKFGETYARLEMTTTDYVPDESNLLWTNQMWQSSNFKLHPVLTIRQVELLLRLQHKVKAISFDGIVSIANDFVPAKSVTLFGSLNYALNELNGLSIFGSVLHRTNGFIPYEYIGYPDANAPLPERDNVLLQFGIRTNLFRLNEGY